MQKQTCFNQENSTQPEMKNNYHHPIFLQYKKVINLFPLYNMKKNSIKK